MSKEMSKELTAPSRHNRQRKEGSGQMAAEGVWKKLALEEVYPDLLNLCLD